MDDHREQAAFEAYTRELGIKSLRWQDLDAKRQRAWRLALQAAANPPPDDEPTPRATPRVLKLEQQKGRRVERFDKNGAKK